MASTLAFTIDVAGEEQVLEAIKSAPQYGVKVAGAIKHTIKTIHGLENLHRSCQLNELEVYLGRTAASPGRLLQRWEYHRHNRKHKHAAVLFTCDMNRSLYLEELAINLLQELKNRGSLCVGNANIAKDSRGRVSTGTTAVIYMTWGKNAGDTEYEKPTMDVIREVADVVGGEMSTEVTKQQLQRGLMTLKRLTDKVKLAWVPL